MTPSLESPTPTPEARAPGVLPIHAGELLEQVAVATALAGLDGRVAFANPAFLTLWGLERREDVLGREVAGDLWVEPEKARSFFGAHDAQSVWQGELVARRLTGPPIPVRVTAQLLREAQGQPSRLLGSFVDASAEHALRRSFEAERWLSEMLVDRAGVLVMSLDEEGRFVRFNRECERISGRVSAPIQI